MRHEEVDGLQHQEIADLTERPLGTVKVIVHRGRVSLPATGGGLRAQRG